MKRAKLRRIILASILAALSFVLMRFTEFPLFPSAPFLKVSLGDIPLLIGAVYLGPWYGISIALVKDLLFLASGGGGGGVLGAFINFIAISTFAFVVGIVVKNNINLKKLILGFALGTLAMAAIMIPVNFWTVPLFLPKVTHLWLINYIFKVNVPFNLLEGLIDSVITIATLFALKRRNVRI